MCGLYRNVPPQLTLDHVSPATRLLEKRRQKIEVQEALEAQKADFARYRNFGLYQGGVMTGLLSGGRSSTGDGSRL